MNAEPIAIATATTLALCSLSQSESQGESESEVRTTVPAHTPDSAPRLFGASSSTHSPTAPRATFNGGDEPSVTREQAGAIATLLRLLPGRATWDQLATLNAVEDASRTHRDLAAFVAGCLRIAQNPVNRTPAALRYAEAWRRAAETARASTRANESCPVPGHEGYPATNCAGCRVDRSLELLTLQREERTHPPERFQEYH